MKKFMSLVGAAFSVFLSVAYADSPQTNLTLSELSLHPNTNLAVRVLGANSHGVVDVEINNIKSSGLKIWDERSCGGCWRVLKISNNKITTYYQDQTSLVTMLTRPGTVEVRGNGSIKTTIDLNSDDWPTAAKSNVSFRTGDLVIAVYDVSPSSEADKQHIWWGVAAGFLVVP